MKAVKIVKPRSEGIFEVPEPGATSGTTSLSIHRIGLCGTDLRTYTGDNPIVSYPRIFVHEIGATLNELAEIAGRRYDAGTVVSINPYTTCGTCTSCRSGRRNACQYNETLGNHRDGAAVERFRISHERVYPLEELSVDQAVCVEPLSVGFHAAARGNVSPGDTVVVLGCGMIGLSAIGGAAARGGRVVAIDLNETKLTKACAVGATEAFNAATVDVGGRVADLTGGEGASVRIEAIGLPSTYRQAIYLMAFAGRVVYIGYASEDVAFTTKYFVQNELDIRGSRNANDEDYRSVIDAMRAGAIDLEALITHRYPIDSAADAFAFGAGNPNLVTKAMFEVR